MNILAGYGTRLCMDDFLVGFLRTVIWILAAKTVYGVSVIFKHLFEDGYHNKPFRLRKNALILKTVGYKVA
jgi:hypothetical protein